MADVMGSFLRGRQFAQAEAEHKQQLEDNKIRSMVLKHELDGLKISDQIRARELAKQNLDLMQGQPAADLPQETTTTRRSYLPSQSEAGVMSGLPDIVSSLVRARLGGGDTGDTGAPLQTMPAPAAQSTDHTYPVTSSRPAAVNIPGVEGLGVPGVQMRPQSLEDLVRAKIQTDMATPYTLAPGAVRKIGERTIGEGGPTYHSVGAGGLVATDASGQPRVVAPGRPTTPPRPLVVNGNVLDPNNPGGQPLATYPPQSRAAAGTTGQPTLAQRAAAERWKAKELFDLEKRYKASQTVPTVDEHGKPTLDEQGQATFTHAIDPNTMKPITPMTAEELNAEKARIQTSYLQQIGYVKPGATAPAQTPLKPGEAPQAPAGWQYVPKAGGGWTAVPAAQ